jgi:hypothetical protein
MPGVSADLLRVLRVLPLIEWRRRRLGLHAAVVLSRADAGNRCKRSAEDRARLRRVIGAVDVRMPGGANCVRRALLEMALDGGAARERLFAGLRRGGGKGSGHMWLESDPARETYDAVISI